MANQETNKVEVKDTTDGGKVLHRSGRNSEEITTMTPELVASLEQKAQEMKITVKELIALYSQCP